MIVRDGPAYGFVPFLNVAVFFMFNVIPLVVIVRNENMLKYAEMIVRSYLIKWNKIARVEPENGMKSREISQPYR